MMGGETAPTMARLHCPACRYDLKGLSEPRCPECGTVIDPAVIRRRASRRGRWLWSLAVTLPCVYLPYVWLLLADFPWSSYRWHWIAMWPGLPALFPTQLLLGRFSTAVEMAGMGVLAAVVVSIVVYLGSRGKRWLIAVALIVLALSSVNSWGAWHAFRM